MYFDNSEHIRKQMKQRYNRRFFIVAHAILLLLTLIAAGLFPPLGPAVLMLALALIPHALYLAYKEYRDWLEDRIERELDRKASQTYEAGKRKRYADEAAPSTFRLTDDGEIEEVRAEAPRRDWDFEDRRAAPRRTSSDTRREKPRRRERDDSDEFDLKKLMKKVKKVKDLLD